MLEPQAGQTTALTPGSQGGRELWQWGQSGLMERKPPKRELLGRYCRTGGGPDQQAASPRAAADSAGTGWRSARSCWSKTLLPWKITKIALIASKVASLQTICSTARSSPPPRRRADAIGL